MLTKAQILNNINELKEFRGDNPEFEDEIDDDIPF